MTLVKVKHKDSDKTATVDSAWLERWPDDFDPIPDSETSDEEIAHDKTSADAEPAPKRARNNSRDSAPVKEQ